ncbi:MAG: 50S ribosomal protein L21 [Planctomycetota bacterium]
MYAVIEDSGRQFKVEKNSVILVDLREAEAGGQIVFDRVIALSGDKGFRTGNPINGCSVTGTVIRQEKAAKIIIGKFKRRKDYRRTQGHRQGYLRVRIDSIKD